MSISLHTRLLIAWAILVGITLLSWWLGTHHGAGSMHVDPVVGLSAMAITLVKVRVILLEFMDVRHAPVKLKYITAGWLTVFIVAMATTYFVVR